jgi:hypothetical protein
MLIFKRAHAFQVIKSVLEALPIKTRLILDAIEVQLSCGAIVDGLIFDWHSLFDNALYIFANVTIQSLHNSAGGIIRDTTDAANPAILLPVVDGALADCLKNDVCFVRVLCTINFSLMVTIPNQVPTVLCVGFYIELPQGTQAMINGAGTAYNLTTWLSAADLSTLTRKQVQANIRSHALMTALSHSAIRILILLMLTLTLSSSERPSKQKFSSLGSSKFVSQVSSSCTWGTATNPMLHLSTFAKQPSYPLWPPCPSS